MDPLVLRAAAPCKWGILQGFTTRGGYVTQLLYSRAARDLRGVMGSPGADTEILMEVSSSLLLLWEEMHWAPYCM